ncbi:MAG: DoxX family protein [Deltaproteobacteria bacterium]|nr:DoxX family protein [Deltaproteobacteria bacterium]MBV8451125.1 DoxX family protein [Deltaproteobacteria bacterium]
MRSSIATIIIRSLFGFAFVVFGLNKFLHFMPNPAEPPAAMDFFGALFKTGYFIPLLAATEIVSGALLLAGIFAPFALVLIAPVIVNIFMFHLFLAPGGLPMAVILVALELTLAWQYRWAYGAMFSSGRAEAMQTPLAVEAHA